MEFTIVNIKAREVLDSRGNPTVEAEVVLKGGALGSALVPSGASTGMYEALELRDGDPRRFKGRGVLKAVENVNKVIAKAVIGLDARNQRQIDETMIALDGTPNKAKLGANAILSVSMAVARAAAAQSGLPLYKYLGGSQAKTLPVPLMNIINGGKHAGNELEVQEFIIIPVNADTFREALRMGVEIYHSLKELLKERYGLAAINVGDEGGFAPPFKKSREALDSLIEAIKRAGYSPEGDVYLALDCAASNFYSTQEGVYKLDGELFTPSQLLEFYLALIDEYPIASIEDPFHEEDYSTHAELVKKTKGRLQVVGDDLFVTNVSRLKKGIELQAANALLLKVNQIGSLTEALEAAKLAQSSGFNIVVSHRSGETEDSFIADLAVAINSGQIKTGAPARGERTAKYNRLLRIEEELAGRAVFPGASIFKK